MPNSSISIKAIIAVGSLFSMGALTLLAAAAYLITDPFSNNAAAVANTPTLRPVAMMVQHHPTVTYTPIPTLVPTEEPTPTEVIETETPTATATAQAVAQVVVLPVSGEAQPIANTATPIPPTNTAVPTPANTATSSAPTADWAAYHAQQTATALAAVPTVTPIPPTNTAVPATNTPLPTNTAAPTSTVEATATETETPTPEATATDVAVATPTTAAAAADTPTPTATPEVIPAVVEDFAAELFDACDVDSGVVVIAVLSGFEPNSTVYSFADETYYSCIDDVWYQDEYNPASPQTADADGKVVVLFGVAGYSYGTITFWDDYYHMVSTTFDFTVAP